MPLLTGKELYFSFQDQTLSNYPFDGLPHHDSVEPWNRLLHLQCPFPSHYSDRSFYHYPCTQNQTSIAHLQTPPDVQLIRRVDIQLHDSHHELHPSHFLTLPNQ